MAPKLVTNPRPNDPTAGQFTLTSAFCSVVKRSKTSAPVQQNWARPNDQWPRAAKKQGQKQTP